MLPDDWFEQLRKTYPRRLGGQGWGHVKKRVPELVKHGENFADILDGVKKYRALMDATRASGGPYVLQARTFFGPGEWWLEDYELPTDGSVELTLDQEAEICGLTRQPGESDAQLKGRIGVAQTKKHYGIG